MTPVLDPAVCLEPAALDGLMPMHLLLDRSGVIRHVGPTLRRVLDSVPVGQAVDEVLDFGASGALSGPGLEDLAGRPLRLFLRGGRGAAFRGVLVPLARGTGYVLDLSFGISAVEAVGTYGLSQSDFAPTDLTVELLFLHEANLAAMGEWRRLTERLDRARAAAEERAMTDSLTGLGNRRAFERDLEDLIARRADFAVVLVDLDFLKSINDTHGHEEGDRALLDLAREVNFSLTAEDAAYRIGGDEFALLLPGAAPEAQVTEFGIRLYERLGHLRRRREIPISASIGATLSGLYPAPGPKQMLRDADAALYLAKRGGRNRLAIFSIPAILDGETSREIRPGPRMVMPGS